jgi:cullin-associated NEDD8-dissociated protein 1
VRTTSPAAFTRATVVIAVKYSIVERPEKIDEIIYPEISSFLMLIKDHDRVSCRYIFALMNKQSVCLWWPAWFLNLMVILKYDMQHVRRAAVLALSTFAHNKPNLIKGLLPELLPLLYDQTIVKVIEKLAFSELMMQLPYAAYLNTV